MEIDIRTLVFVIGFTHLLQLTIFFLQYKINRVYKGIGWWLLWSAAEMFGFIIMLFRDIPAFLPYAILIQNTFIIMGIIFIYIGLIRFLDKKENIKLIIAIFTLFEIGLIFLIFLYNNYQIRSAYLNFTVATVTIITAINIYINNITAVKSSANFCVAVFMLHGFFFIYRTFVIITAKDYPDDFFATNWFNILLFVETLAVSLFYTFGFILMLNQRLNYETRDAKENLELIFNASPEAIVITRLKDGMIVKLNDKFNNISGYDKTESLGNSSVTLKLWKDPTDRSNFIKLLKKNSYYDNFAAVFCPKSGTEFNGLISGKLLMIQNEEHALSIIKNYSEIKLIEIELKLSEEKFRLISENSFDWIYFIGEDKTLRFNSPSFEKITGYTLKEAYDNIHLVEDIIHPDDKGKSTSHFMQLETLNHSEIIEYRILRKNGAVRWIHHQCNAVFRNNKFYGRIVTNRDVTENKLALEEIKHLNETLDQKVRIRTTQLEAAYAEMEAFAYSVSHDLKAPLRAIDGFTKIILENKEDVNDENIRLLKLISHNSQNMGKLIEDLLNYAKVEKANISAKPLNILNIIRDIITEMKKEINKKNIAVNINHIPEVKGDKVLFQQIWFNLIENAIKFTSQNVFPEIVIGGSVDTEKKEVIYSIKDNGVGFEMKYVGKLFNLFERLHNSEEFEGTGIGLAIVKKAVNRHGGRVWAESILGEGAVFYFTIPITG